MRSAGLNKLCLYIHPAFLGRVLLHPGKRTPACSVRASTGKDTNAVVAANDHAAA